ncbi:PP2C family protein-serine/threonine phosphatase [Magnetospirillum sp. UT-4]|uniref:PP2C family protein-serine/threonine phosphatase n=1 Tax=Magnetospirillum sp. UT-4 TaxID=2681467 RepID=UPI001385AF4B|nr:SpoIIE family protein phosphatase [Magnetospirillum sp. UT-4]CAA7615209.1 conserved hypothetical protein [Magnetospirillum sp. UT-4]
MNAQVDAGLVLLGGQREQRTVQRAEAVSTPRHPVRSRDLRILLVEDMLGDARLIQHALRNQTDLHPTVVHVETLAAARDKLVEEEPFDVALLDLSLPDSAGIETVTRLLAAAPLLPIVVMTGLSDPVLAERALELGAQDYLVKGEDPGSAVGRAIRYAITRMAAQIERGELIDRLRQEQDRVGRELAAARAMQFDLLPRPGLVEPGLRALGISIEAYFEPSSMIGGDLWGLFERGAGRLDLFSFDFSGHGISAALNVFRLHTLMGSLCRSTSDPGELLTAANRELKTLIAPGQFATMFHAVLDLENGELAWAGAGAPPPLVFTTDGMRMLDTSGLPLGISAGTRYPTRCMEFPHGAALFVYSDAMTESLCPDGTMVGEDGLRAMVVDCASTQGLAGIMAQFQDAVPGGSDDDLTALWLRRT